MDQVWHPPIDPAPRGAVGLARIYADAYGKNVVSREQQVGVTKAGRLHIDQNFAANWRRDIDVFKFESASERVNNKCFHIAAQSQP